MRRKFLDCCLFREFLGAGAFTTATSVVSSVRRWRRRNRGIGWRNCEDWQRKIHPKFIIIQHPNNQTTQTTQTTIVIHWKSSSNIQRTPNTVQGRARFIRRLPTPDRVLVKLVKQWRGFCQGNPRVTCVTSQGPDRQGWLWDASLPGVRSSPYTAPFFRARHSRRRVVNVVSMSMVWCLVFEDKVSLSNIE